MKKVGRNIRKGIHVLLTSIIAILGMTSCIRVKYGVPDDILEPSIIDTTYVCKYGVFYTPYSDGENEENGNSDQTESSNK